MGTPEYDELALEPLEAAPPGPWQWRKVKSARRTFALQWVTDSGEVLMTLTPSGKRKVESELEVTPAGRCSPELPLLIAMGFYLIVLVADEMTALTAAGIGG